MDTLTRAERSKRMSLIKSRDTQPELLIRQIAHACGYRYRLHVKDLPGQPDLVFPKYRKVIFVHGCYWHRHPKCKLARLPKSKLDFWVPKLTQNRERDLKTVRQLRRDGWQVLVIWECQTKRTDAVERRIRTFLGKKNAKR